MVPEIEVNEVLLPKHSKQLVLDELEKGHKILSNYIDGYLLLELEGEG